MKEPSDKRKRTLALQDRALRFTNAVNISCPQCFTNKPSATAWGQLVRAADGTSNNLIEADGASSDADVAEQRELESEANQLAAIFASIILNMRRRLDREKTARRTG